MNHDENRQQSEKNAHLVPGMGIEATYKAFIGKKSFERFWKLFLELWSDFVIHPAAFSDLDGSFPLVY